MTAQSPPAEFQLEDVEIIEAKTVYQGFFKAETRRLRHRMFKGGWGEEISREIWLRGEAVGVLLYDPRHDLIALVEQFRIGAMDEAAGPWCLEVVAGMIEPGETPLEVAKRELWEETKLRTDHLDYICSYLSSPGGSDEKLHLYCGYCDLRNAGGIHGLDVEGEDIKVHSLAADEVFASLYDNRFNNAATLIALQWLQHNRDRLRREHADKV